MVGTFQDPQQMPETVGSAEPYTVSKPNIVSPPYSYPYIWLQNLQIQRANCIMPLYGTIYKGLKHPWILVSAEGSWNQFPVGTKGIYSMFFPILTDG